MKGSGLVSIGSLLLLLHSAAAWPWPKSFNDQRGLIMRRQDGDSDSKPTENASPSKETTADNDSETTTDALESTGSDENKDKSKTENKDENTDTEKSSDGEATATAEKSASPTGKDKDSEGKNGSKTSDKASKTTNVDPRLPPGGIEMVTPAVIAGAQYYKIGDYVTFAWNYTSLSVTPSYIDVLASCSVNSETYTIASNQTVDPTGAVTWDTNEYQATATAGLLTEKYTLIVVDADAGISATPRAGYLGVSDQYVFGMYEPQPYTPLNEFKCATCSGALSLHERQALGLVLAMSTITVISFSWFAGGFGVFS